MTELRAIDQEGVKFASMHGGINLVVESDCIQAVNLVSSQCETRNEMGTMVENIRKIIPISSRISFVFTPRGNNGLLDFIAKSVRREM